MNQRDHTSLGSIALLRLPEVLKIVPVSASTWWSGVKSGKFPQSIKLGPRTTCWRRADIIALIERSAGKSRELPANRNSEAENGSQLDHDDAPGGRREIGASRVTDSFTSVITEPGKRGHGTKVKPLFTCHPKVLAIGPSH